MTAPVISLLRKKVTAARKSVMVVFGIEPIVNTLQLVGLRENTFDTT